MFFKELRFKERNFNNRSYKSYSLKKKSENSYSGYLCGELDDIEVRKRLNEKYYDIQSPLSKINSELQPNENPFYQKISSLNIEFQPIIVEIKYKNKNDEQIGPYKIQICPN